MQSKTPTSHASRVALQKLGKEIHLSPLPGSDRSCLISLGDGTSRLGITQLTTHTHPRGVHAGAQFLRVSFRFAGDENDPASQFHASYDTLWVLIDPKTGDVVFGPDDGIQVRTRGAGIGSYLLGQVVRMLGQVDLKNYYRLHDIALPMHASDDLPKGEEVENSLRVEQMLSRAGFYISGSGAGLIAGVRKLNELKARWNQDKVRFLNPSQLIEHADKWLTASAHSQAECQRLGAIVTSLQTELKTQKEVSLRREREHEVLLGELRADLLTAEQNLSAVTSAAQSNPEAADVPPSEPTNHSRPSNEPCPRVPAGQLLVGVNGRLLIWLWAMFGLGIAYLALGLTTFFV